MINTLIKGFFQACVGKVYVKKENPNINKYVEIQLKFLMSLMRFNGHFAE